MSSKSASHRKEKRSPAERVGKIKFGMFKSVECKLEDLSSSGAKLLLEKDVSLPATFNMKLIGATRNINYKCEKKWQSGAEVGVEFLSSKHE